MFVTVFQKTTLKLPDLLQEDCLHRKTGDWHDLDLNCPLAFQGTASHYKSCNQNLLWIMSRIDDR